LPVGRHRDRGGPDGRNTARHDRYGASERFPGDEGFITLHVEHDVEALLTERDSFREIAQRLQADFENYRKRVATQTADDIDRATGRIAESLLPVLDACEAAFIAHPAEIEPLFNLLLTELKKQGLEALDLNGQTFNPAQADAVIHEEGEGDGNGNAQLEAL
jgi:molecular chaperone GrpE